MGNDIDSGRTLPPLSSWRGRIIKSALPPVAKHVALTLSMHMNEVGSSCFPSLDTLADETSLSRRSVQRAIGELERWGWLAVSRPSKQGRGVSNRYTAVIRASE